MHVVADIPNGGYRDPFLDQEADAGRVAEDEPRTRVCRKTAGYDAQQ